MEATCYVADCWPSYCCSVGMNRETKRRMKLRYKLQGNVNGEHSRTFIITYMNKLILKLTSMCVE